MIRLKKKNIRYFVPKKNTELKLLKSHTSYFRRRRRVRNYIRFYIYTYKYIKRLSNMGYIVNVHVSFSNIILSITRGNGDLLFCFTQGMVWDKNLKKGSGYAGNRVGFIFGKKVYSKCYFPLVLKIYSRITTVVEATVSGLFNAGLYFSYCILIPIAKHNGCRNQIIKRKKRRIRRKKDLKY